MFANFFFISWRIGQLVTLIPPVGMLAWFVNGFLDANMLTPPYILVLFIVSVLGSVWALETLVRYGATKRSASFVGAVDLCFFGALIAGVYQLGAIAEADCGDFSRTGTAFLSTLGPFGYFGQRAGWTRAEDPGKVCAMLKASFAFGIMNVVSFFVTAVLAWFVHQHEDRHEDERHGRRRSSSHSRRRGHHRRRSGSGRRGEFHV